MDEDTAQAFASLQEFVRNRRPQNPSPRDPSISTESSYPDKIDAGLQADEHRTWGFVIYRTTYQSDADWAEFLRRLRYWTSEDMVYFNGQDILDLMTWTVFDDESLFDGADTAAIRRHFHRWAETTVLSEIQQPSGDATLSMRSAPRYRYCVQVDADALRSVLHDAPPPPEIIVGKKGWVKLIQKDWIRPSENPRLAGRELDDGYEPIEGVTEKDVGWIRCPCHTVMTEFYVDFLNPNGYSVAYQRPPAVVGFPYDE